MPSDIQVFVRFKEQSVFAGEELRSIITFRNVASISDNGSADKTRKSRGWTALGNASEWSRPGGSGGLSSQNPRLAARNSEGTRKTTKRGHGTTTSLTIPFAESSVARSASWTASPVNHSTPPHQHQRSVSIISLGSPDVGNEDRQRANFPPRSRPTLNRGRPTSSQMYPKSIRGNYDAPSSRKPFILASRISPYRPYSFRASYASSTFYESECRFPGPRRTKKREPCR
jgi:RAB6A-GEF complex partner protein 2